MKVIHLFSKSHLWSLKPWFALGLPLMISKLLLNTSCENMVRQCLPSANWGVNLPFQLLSFTKYFMYNFGKLIYTLCVISWAHRTESTLIRQFQYKGSAAAELARNSYLPSQQRRTFVCRQEGLEPPSYSKYRDIGVYSLNKTGSRQKVYFTWANAASWVAAAQPPLSQVPLLLWKLSLTIGTELPGW